MVFGSYHYFPQDEVSDFEALRLNFGVVVLSHKVLAACNPLFSHRPSLHPGGPAVGAFLLHSFLRHGGLPYS